MEGLRKQTNPLEISAGLADKRSNPLTDDDTILMKTIVELIVSKGCPPLGPF